MLIDLELTLELKSSRPAAGSDSVVDAEFSWKITVYAAVQRHFIAA